MDCDCCSATDGGTATTDDATSESAGTTGESTAVTEPDALDSPLSESVAGAFGTAFDRDPVDSLADWVALLPEVFPRWPPAVADLCHAPDGPHRASTPDREHRFVCVLDALLLPPLLDDPVTVRSEPPVGDGVTFELVPGDAADVSVDAPDGTVVSFGAIPEAPDGDVTAEHTYGAICPAIHAFPSLATYERWAAETDAETTPLSVERASRLAVAMAAAGD